MGPLGSRTRSSTSRWQFWLAGGVVHIAVLLTWRLHTGGGLMIPERANPATLVLLEPFPRPRLRPAPIAPRRPPVPPLSNATNAVPESAAGPEPTAPIPAVDSSEASPAPVAAIHRNFGDSRLWVRPLGSDQLAAIHRLTRTTAQLADSVSRAVVQAFLDSMAFEAERAPRPPSWTGTIAGARFGLDSRFVYLAGLKIPSILLGLLPISGGANQSKAFDRSDQMFDDLRRAAVRSATLDDFKAAVRELRAQSEEEHQLNQAGRGNVPEESPGIGPQP